MNKHLILGGVYMFKKLYMSDFLTLCHGWKDCSSFQNYEIIISDFTKCFLNFLLWNNYRIIGSCKISMGRSYIPFTQFPPVTRNFCSFIFLMFKFLIHLKFILVWDVDSNFFFQFIAHLSNIIYCHLYFPQ